MPITKKFSIPMIFSFWFSIIGGYILHLYAFTNIVPNSDGINRVYDLQEMTVSGRWFLHYATMPSGFMQMPTFIGLLTILTLSLTVVLIIDLLQIKEKYLAGITGLAFISFPSLGFTFLYLFTASAYSIGIFLSVFSVWLYEKGKKFRLFAAISLALSMGIYQAYAPFAIGLSMLLVIKALFQKGGTFKSIVLNGIGKIIYLSLGALLYYIILECALMVTGQELLPYLGMENKSYPITALPSLVLSCYKQVIVFFFLPQYGIGTSSVPLMIFHIGMTILSLISISLLLKPFLKTELWRVLAILMLCALLPLGFGFVQIISPWSAPTPLMQYPYVLTYAFMIFLIDQASFKLPMDIGQKLRSATLCLFFLVSLGGGWLSNLLYTASAQAHRATESYVTRMMSRVESVEGYDIDMPVLFIGAFPEGKYYAQIEAYGLIDHYSAPKNSVLPLNKHVYYYLNHWLNIPIEEPEEATLLAMSDSEEFADMTFYPNDGSVKIIDEQVVVKIGESYIPKSDYEIAYETAQKKS